MKLPVAFCVWTWIAVAPLGGFAQLDEAQARAAIGQFRKSFENTHIRFRMGSATTAAGEGLRSEVWIFGDSAVRVVDEHPVGRSDESQAPKWLNKRELLFQADRQLVRIEALARPSDGKQMSGQKVGGKLDWHQDNSGFLYGFWLGCVRDGTKNHSIAEDSPFWTSGKVSILPDGELEVRQSDETFFRFGFEMVDQELRLNLIEMNYMDARPSDEMAASCVRFELVYDSDTGQLSQWRWIPVSTKANVEDHTAVFTIDSINPIDQEAAPLRPREFRIENGTRVYVDMSDPTVYEYHDGEIRKAGD